MATVTFRKAEIDDATLLAGIHARSWSAAYKGIIDEAIIEKKNAERPAKWPKYLSGPHDIYLAYDDGEPVGFFTVRACHDEDLSGAGEVSAIYLDPAFYRKGYGRQMLAEALRLLRERGYSHIVLWVLARNQNARRFYEACGFAPDGAVQHNVYGANTNCLRYAIDIVPASKTQSAP